MKKIIIKRHAFDRVKERFPKFKSEYEFSKFIHSRIKMIEKLPNQKNIKLNMNYSTIPIIIVIYKSHTRINVITAYINNRTKKGKYINKKLKNERKK